MSFEGVRPVLHLPFAATADEPIVEDELLALVETMIEAGVDGLVVLGLASESWTLTDRERERVVEIVAGKLDGRLPLAVGIDGSTAVARDRARRAAAVGATGLMVLPARGAPGRDSIVAHFASVAEAGGVPLLIQDSPQVTGVILDVETIIAAVGAHPLVTSLKVEVPGAGPKTTAARDAGVRIVAGWGGVAYLDQLDRGAIGCMPGCDLGPAMLAINRAARSGQRAAAQGLYRNILPLLTFETASLDLLLLSAKHHLRRRRIFSTEFLRAPARRLDAQETETLDGLLDELAGMAIPGFSGHMTRQA